MILQDILTAIPWGLLLAFSIGPGFFVLLETSITKGFRAAFVFDLGIVFSDIIFILIAYLSTNQLLEQLKDNPSLFIVGGIIMVVYGLVSFFLLKRNKNKEQVNNVNEITPKTNYFSLFFKGFLLNFINIGVLGFWMMVIITYGPQMNMDINRIIVFFCAILGFYLLFDIAKIILAKQVKNKLDSTTIYKIKRIISLIIFIFGLFSILQGIFPEIKKELTDSIELIE